MRRLLAQAASRLLAGPAAQSSSAGTVCSLPLPLAVQPPSTAAASLFTASSSLAEGECLSLNTLRDRPGATHQARRGRGRAAVSSPPAARSRPVHAGQAQGPRHRLRPGQDRRQGPQGPESACRRALCTAASMPVRTCA